ncbi:MAG: hypothetical protein HHJ12_13655 [Glaciimonas sp.]|nr:hypothetical protein [Glaciimonas sp.]
MNRTLLRRNNDCALRGLQWIATLYGFEKVGKDFDFEARQQLRQQEAKPALASFHAWLVQVLHLAPLACFDSLCRQRQFADR